MLYYGPINIAWIMFVTYPIYSENMCHDKIEFFFILWYISFALVIIRKTFKGFICTNRCYILTRVILLDMELLKYNFFLTYLRINDQSKNRLDICMNTFLTFNWILHWKWCTNWWKSDVDWRGRIAIDPYDF